MGGLEHSALLVVVVLALGTAAWRAAGAVGAEGPERAVAAAPLAAAAAGLHTLLLGRVGAAGDAWILAAAAVLTLLATLRLVGAPSPTPAPAWPGWRWAALLGALAGAALAWEAWLLRRPPIGQDGLAYHLPEAIGWLQSGAAGDVQPLVSGLSVGSYPRTHELLLSWTLALGGGWAPTTLLEGALAGLLVLAGWTGCRRLGASPAVALLAGVVVLASPYSLAELGGPWTDVPAMAWLVCCGALCVAAGRRPGLLGPALAAAGLAVGTKTTTLPLVVVVVGAAGWRSRHALRSVWRPTLAGAGLGVAVGAPWYVANLLSHGWPLWPLSTGPGGDPVPGALAPLRGSLLAHLDVLDGRLGQYGRALGGGVALLAGALLAPLLARRGHRRAVVAAGGATVLATLAWASAPYTAIREGELAAGALRYAQPVLGAATVALVLATRHGGRRSRAAVAVLLAALAVDVWRARGIGAPYEPGLLVPVAGAAIGVAAGLLASAAGRRPIAALAGRWGALTGRWSRVAATALAGALVASGCAAVNRHYVLRHARAGLYDAGLMNWFAAQPGWRDGRRPVVMWPFTIATLSGDSFEHPVRLLADRLDCATLRGRRVGGWVVLQTAPGVPFGAYADCLADRPPGYSDATFRAWPPG